MIGESENHIIAHLQKLKILNKVTTVQPISIDASGADVLDIQAEDATYILKITDKSKVNDTNLLNTYVKEYKFYTMPESKVLKGKLLHFIPKVYYNEDSDQYLLILMKKYKQIPLAEWNSELLGKAVELMTEKLSAMLPKVDRLLVIP